MPQYYDPVQVQQLISSIDQLPKELEAHKEQLLVTDRRVRNIKIAGGFAMVVGLLGIAVGLRGNAIGEKAQDAADKVEAIAEQRNVDRIANNAAACVQQNAQRQQVREAIKDSLLALVPPGATLTPEQQATIARYNAEVDLKLPYRDCSPAGIEAYFKNPPKDPNTGG